MHAHTTKPQVTRIKSTCETIAVEGGAEEEPARAHWAEQRRYDLLHQAVRHIPKAHRIGWLHALARYAGSPLTPTPGPAELAYLTWSEQRHTNPRSTTAQSIRESTSNPAVAPSTATSNPAIAPRLIPSPNHEPASYQQAHSKQPSTHTTASMGM